MVVWSDLPSLMLTGLPSLKRGGGFLCALGSGMLQGAGERAARGRGRAGHGWDIHLCCSDDCPCALYIEVPLYKKYIQYIYCPTVPYQELPH